MVEEKSSCSDVQGVLNSLETMEIMDVVLCRQKEFKNLNNFRDIQQKPNNCQVGFCQVESHFFNILL